MGRNSPPFFSNNVLSTLQCGAVPHCTVLCGTAHSLFKKSTAMSRQIGHCSAFLNKQAAPHSAAQCGTALHCTVDKIFRMMSCLQCSAVQCGAALHCV